MKAYRLGITAAVWFSLVLGCQDASKSKTDDPTAKSANAEEMIKANLAKLNPEDQKLAEAQQFLAVDSHNRLGAMGTPYKVMVKDQPVFLCCKGCQNAALKDPDRTVEKVEVMINLNKLSPEDRKIAEEQRFCVIDDDRRLGSMGAPFKVMVKNQPVFLCCKGCQHSALKDPDKTLAKVKELKEKSKAASETAEKK